MPVPQGYRPFLDGLRALAVSAVVIYHLHAGWLPGGFLGVDVFFVLSGYLITGLLLAEHARTGRIDLPAFWARRVRRLLPALALVLVVVTVAVAASGDILAATSLRWDSLSALLYVANWRFVLSGQDYFEQFVAISPLRHTWSLGVEEQFYAAWPFITWLVLGRLGPRRLGALAVTIALASFLAMALLFDPADPSRAYYGTDTRIGQLLVGAVAAVLLAGGWRERLVAAARPLAIPAVGLLLVAMALLDEGSAWYFGPGAALVAIAVAVLIAGLEGGSPVARVLSVRPAVALGVVSYGVYLWHFPVIRFVGDRLGDTVEPAVAAVALLATLALAGASFVLVERPIRRGRPPIPELTPRRVAWLLPLVSGTLAVVILAVTPWAPPAAFADPGDPSPTADATGVRPAASPVPGSTAAPPAFTIGLLGDSVAASLLPGFEAEAGARGWLVVSVATPGCPIGAGLLYGLDGRPSPFNDRCLEAPGKLAELLAARPAVVIWHDLQSTLARRDAAGGLLLPGTPGWRADLLRAWRTVFDRTVAAGATVVIVLPPLRSQDAPGCAGARDADRCREIQAQDAAIRPATLEFAATLSGRADVLVVTVDDLLCPEGTPCPGRLEGIAVRLIGYDQTHFTPEGARWFVPRLLERLGSLLPR